ncbi:GIY-YIG nuclease family protein [Legionella sainthelensi]|uniref:GIY-YIG nuclease family protein n=1 Tax=Legionella sainthelensi TaxID=28087 RepID=UPI000E20880D|nr:GIY-YIG nuclease family protein [Legionella sainthelensi]
MRSISGIFYPIKSSHVDNLIKRVWVHKNNLIPEFTAKYTVHILVYYEVHESYIEAARREKRFKNWWRQSSLNLIENLNPEWRVL